MTRKKKLNKKTSFIDEVKRFSSYEDHVIGDWVVYQRFSDEKISVGEIRWFCMTSEGMGFYVTDNNLGSFQLGLYRTVEKGAGSTRMQELLISKNSK